MNIDVKLITENFVEILTNTINMSSLFEQIFDSNAEPTTIETVQYVYDNITDEIQPKPVYVDNMSKIKADLEDAVSDEIGIALEDCVKYEDIATEEDVGVVCIDNRTIKMNEDNQIYVDSPELGITHVDSATNADVAVLANNVQAGNINEGISIWVGSQIEYDAIQVKDANVLYFIKEETV